jgi:hypothetical protein
LETPSFAGEPAVEAPDVHCLADSPAAAAAVDVAELMAPDGFLAQGVHYSVEPPAAPAAADVVEWVAPDGIPVLDVRCLVVG